jgi:hypothetical protein
MSWLFSQALVEEYLGENFLDGEQSVPLSGNPIQQAYCAPDKMTVFSRLSRFGMTYKLLTENRGEELLTLFRAGFHAKTSQQPEKVQGLTEQDQECGVTWRGWLAKFDLDSSLWRTAQCSLLEDLNESLATLPRSGMTRNGLLWELPMLEQTTKGTEFGLLQRHSLPTPTCNPHLPNKNANTTGPKNLVEVAQGKWEHLMPQQTWPTPDANCGKRGTQPDWTPKRKSGQPAQYTINQAVRDKMFPTLLAHIHKEGAYPSEYNRKTPGLATHAGGKLNPTWVEWLMGWPLGWTDLNPLETDKSPCVQQQHGEC